MFQASAAGSAALKVRSVEVGVIIIIIIIINIAVLLMPPIFRVSRIEITIGWNSGHGHIAERGASRDRHFSWHIANCRQTDTALHFTSKSSRCKEHHHLRNSALLRQAP